MIKYVPSLLLVLFIWLKLTEQITWSWLWVLSPIWVPLVVISLGFFVLSLMERLDSK